jgi:hypothetical protein
MRPSLQVQFTVLANAPIVDLGARSDLSGLRVYQALAAAKIVPRETLFILRLGDEL